MAKKKQKRRIPTYGRSESEVGGGSPTTHAGNVPLGNTDPTVVQGVMYGGMPNASRMARGGLRQYRGKYT